MGKSSEEIEVAVRDLNEYMYNLFGAYQGCGDQQNILEGMFKWLKENKYYPMSQGEIRSSIRGGFPEVLDKRCFFCDAHVIRENHKADCPVIKQGEK